MMKKFTMVTVNGEDKAPEIYAFAQAIGLESVAPDRYSLLLILELFAGIASRQLNPAKVIHEIRALENLDGMSSRMKPSVQFRHPPLQGLWHKHYLADGLRTMAKNLKNGIHKDGLPWFEQRVKEAVATGENQYMSEDDIKRLTHDAVIGNWLRRSQVRALTGEWLIYAEHEGQNYYLCLGSHDGDHQKIRQQIEAICCDEFPFLRSVLCPLT